ncbi:MAG: hypothetical protein ACREBV_00550 [Candidatus Zixiibacteriota bacterium]
MKVKKFIVAGGGGTTSNQNFVFRGTVGQPAVGKSSLGNYEFLTGFWNGLSQSCCLGITGDIDSDGIDNRILDLTFIVDRIFRSGQAPVCPEEGDLNGDRAPMQILDLTVLVNRIFRSGSLPAPCY